MGTEEEQILEELERIGAFKDGYIDQDEIKQVKKKFRSAVVDMVVEDWNRTSDEIGRAINGIQDVATSGAVWAAKGAGKYGGIAAKATGKFLWETTKAGMREAVFGSEEPAQKGGKR